MSVRVNDFKYIPGKNDAEYIKLLKEALERQKQITNKAIAKIKELSNCSEFPKSSEPERLTDDDFETIRIHLNAYKEKLCNQRRWEEAEEYQRIIDRFMAFASVQPERKKGKWIYVEHDVAMCDGYRCDKCGFFVPWDYQHKFIDFIKDYNYCPSCGAKMEVKND